MDIGAFSKLLHKLLVWVAVFASFNFLFLIFMECFKIVISHFVIWRKKSDTDMRQVSTGTWHFMIDFSEWQSRFIKKLQTLFHLKISIFGKKLNTSIVKRLKDFLGMRSPVITVWQHCPYCFRISSCMTYFFNI